MNTPKIRFKEFKNEWKTYRLSAVAKIYDGTHTTPDYQTTGIPFYSVEHLTSGDFSKTKFISTEVFENENKRVRLEKGDVLMTRIGDIGTAKYIDWDVEASFYVSLALIKPSDVDGVYLSQYIATPQFQRELYLRTIHVAFPKKINLGEIGECLIKKPDLLEQKKIALFLSTVDHKISILSKEYEFLTNYKNGILQKIFNQEIKFKDSYSKDFPRWEQKKLGSVAKLKSGYPFNSNTYVTDGEYKIITISNVQSGYMKHDRINSLDELPTDIQEHQRLKIGDLLVSMTGNVGRICRVEISKSVLNQRVGVFIANGININFLFYCLNNQSFTKAMELISQGGAQKNIGTKDIESYPLQIPCLEEQEKIANFLSAIDGKISNVQQQLDLTKQYKQGLLQQMFV